MKDSLGWLFVVFAAASSGPVIAGPGPEAEAEVEMDAAPRSLLAPVVPEIERPLAQAYTKRNQAAFVPPTAAARREFRAAFALLLGEARRASPGEPATPARAAFDRLGFRVETLRVEHRDVWAVIETTQPRRGGGVYLVRPGPDAGPWTGAPAPGNAVTRVVLMAPHPRSDRDTDLLGQRLFGLTRARAYLQATVHRRVPAPDGTPSDPAHRDDTFFQAATEALDSSGEGQLFVQLHGFDTTKHDKVTRGFGAIVSDGSGSAPGPIVTAAAEVLRQRQPGGVVAVWGVDVRHLGATTNAQGRLIRARGMNAFMHIEMAGALREAAAVARPEASSIWHALVALAGTR